MACDLQGTLGDGTMKLKLHTKMFKFAPHELTYSEEPFILGFSGNVDTMMEACDFFNNPESYGGRPPKLRGLTTLVMTEKGRIFYASDPVKWLRVKHKNYAIGSGALTSLGAMAAGATPKEAVKAACTVDPFSGMGIKVLSF